MCEGARSAKTLGSRKRRSRERRARGTRVKRRVSPRPARPLADDAACRPPRRLGGCARGSRSPGPAPVRLQCGKNETLGGAALPVATGDATEPARRAALAVSRCAEDTRGWPRISGRCREDSHLARLHVSSALLKGRAASRERHLHQEDSTSGEKTRGRLAQFLPLSRLLSPTDLPTPNRETRLESHPSASVIPAPALLIGRDRDDGRRGVRGAPSLSVGDQERRGRVGRGHHR